LAAILWSCGHSGDGHGSHEGHDHETEDAHGHEGHDHGSTETAEGGHADEIVFSREQAEAVGLAVEEIAPGVFSSVIKTSGRILSAQGDEQVVVATSNGIVSFAGSGLVEGSYVKAGEAIVTISAKNIADGDPAARARIEYETAEREYRRAEGLIKEQIISQRDFNEARRRYETAKIAWEAQSSNVTASGVRVTSPINGYIKNRLVGQGDYVSVGQPVATVSQNRRLQLRAEVSENHFKSLRNVGSANFQTSYDNTVYKLSELGGRLLSFGKAAGGESFHIPVTFEFDNVGDFVPGSFATVWLLANPQEGVISVPVSAVTEEQGLTFVYLRLDDEGYRKQEVALGESDGDRIVVINGLSAGDKVVTRGVIQVRLAAMSGIIPEGHTH
jgi:RND family efflux transporter MFP subunit